MPSVADKQEASSSPSQRRRATFVAAQAQPLHESQHLPPTIDGRGHFTLLPSQLWDSLFEAQHADKASTLSASSSRTPQVAVLAVQFPESHQADRRKGASETQADRIFLYSAHRCEDGEVEQARGVSLSWLPRVYESSSVPVKVAAHTPLTLSSIILATSDAALLDAAQDAGSTFGQDVAGALARQGEHVYLSQGRARVVQTEPTLQGIITPETSILVVYDAEEAAATQGRDLEPPEEAQEARIIESDGGLFIDERFLAGSVLEDFDRQWEEEYLEEAGAIGENPPHASVTSSTLSVGDIQNREVLRSSIEAWREGQRQLGAAEDSEVDEESAVLLAEKGLASIGGFNGDWAIAELVGSSKPRLVRLFCYPSSSAQAASQAYVPPSLLQNLQQSPADYNPFPQIPPRIKLAPIPASRSPESSTSNTPLHCPLPMPFADALTIARVPSALSSHRKYQTLFLDALKGYFEGRKRIVKEGDVIAVGVVKGKVRWVANKGGAEGDSEKKQSEGQADGEGNMADAELVDYSLPHSSSAGSETASTSTLSAQPDGVVHFLVSSLVPELAGPATDSTSENVRPEDLEIREHARRGLLGAVVDPILTKMVQTGIVGSRIGDWDGWLDVESVLPDLPSPGEISPLTSPSAPFGKIVQLLEATLLPQAGSYGLHLTVLLKGARGSGKKTIARWIAKQVGVHLIEINCFDILGDSDTQTEGVLRARMETAASCGPAILLLQNIDALARKSQAMETGQEPAMSHVLRSCVEKLKGTVGQSHRPVAVFGTTSDPDKCPNGILATFKHEISIDAPNEAERLQVLSTAVTQSGLILGPDVSLKDVATQTAALVAADLVDLVARARLASIERVRKAYATLPQPPTEEDLATSGVCVTGADFDSALRKARSNYSESIGAPKIPNVTWDDVGGLASVKSDILDTIQLPLEQPELFTDGLKKRSGILLYGPPGTGKTLLAKAVATSCSLNFFSVKGPELLNMYIGESEANVRRVFQRARDAKPCVIFFDELDSVAPKRGNQGDSGGVMDRIVSQLLAELDGMAGGKEGTDVFVIGATNRPDLLDPALLRPGRFDRLLYLSVSETHAAQLNILQALTRKFKLDPDLGDLSIIAERCPFNLTGADFYALCSDAMLKAMTRKAGEVDDQIARLNASGPSSTSSPHPYPITPQYYLSELATPAEIEVRVKREDFEAALRELSPSVSEKEMEHYRSVQQQFSGPAKGEEGRAENARADRGGKDAQTRMIEEMMKRAGLANGSSDGGAYILDEQDDSKDEEGQQTISTASKGKGKERARPDGAEATHLDAAGQSSSETGELHPPLEAERPQSNGTGSATTGDAIEGASSTAGTEVDGSSGETLPVSNGSRQGGKGKGKGKDKGKGKARA